MAAFSSSSRIFIDASGSVRLARALHPIQPCRRWLAIDRDQKTRGFDQVTRRASLRQSPRIDLTDQLPQTFMQIAAGAVEIEHRRWAAALGEEREARTMAGAAQRVLELLALRDEAGRIDP